MLQAGTTAGTAIGKHWCVAVPRLQSGGTAVQRQRAAGGQDRQGSIELFEQRGCVLPKLPLSKTVHCQCLSNREVSFHEAASLIHTGP